MSEPSEAMMNLLKELAFAQRIGWEIPNRTQVGN